jgi:integrase/recombinase XerD
LPEIESGSRTPIEEAYDAFLIDRRASNYTPRTLKTYRERLREFIKWLDGRGVQHIEQIRATHIRAYLLHLQELRKSPWTVHGQAQVIKTFCRWLVADEWLEKNPMQNVKMPKLPKEILPALSKAEVQKLLDAADNKRDYALILFLLDTGIRALELVNLDGRDIDLRSGVVMIRQGKGQKDRTTYIGARATKALIRYYRAVLHGTPEPNDPVWVSIGIRNSGQRLTYEGLRMTIRRLAANAGVKRATPHTFRRTFALWSLRSGMSIYHLRRIMGHEDLQILLRYLDVEESDLKSAHEQHGAVDKTL